MPRLAILGATGKLGDRSCCSKGHTLGRVYGRLDTLQPLERMRLETGWGNDMEVREAYLRTQFCAGPSTALG